MKDRPNLTGLSIWTQVAYGCADFGPSMAGNILMVFFFFFLTTVAGLSAHWAGTILLISNVWSGLSNLSVGFLCDRTRCRWGRRKIWMCCSAPVLALSFLLLWWVPPLALGGKLIYYGTVAIVFQTAGSCFSIPYGALVVDLAADEHEHLRLNSMRFGFSLAGCIGSLILAGAIATGGVNPSRQLLDIGLICAGIVIVSIALASVNLAERPVCIVNQRSEKFCWRLGTMDFVQSILNNQPLLILVGVYALSLLALQITPALLPYFVVNCLGLKTSAVTKIVLVMQGTALAGLFVWEPLGKKLGKKRIYWTGGLILILAMLGLLQLQPTHPQFIYWLAIVAGFGMSTIYIVPLSMLPEVIDWDELQTGQRREGTFYSLLTFIYQVTIAVSLFGVGQWLNWSGYQSTIPGPVELIQPDSALRAIRLAMVAIPTVAIGSGLLLACFYPINPQTQESTRNQLQQRRLAASASVN